MRLMRIDADSDIYLTFWSLDSKATRRLIAILTIGTGFSGLLLIPSGALRQGWSVVPMLLAVACLVVAAVWLGGKYPSCWKTLYVVFADLGIVSVLVGFSSAFDAMPGVTLLFVVALFSVVYTPPRILLVHTGFSILVTAVFFAWSVEQGTVATLVLSRALTILAVATLPLALRLYISSLRREIETSHTDALTGLRTARGLDLALDGVARESRTVGIELVQIDDPGLAAKPVGRAAMDEALAELAERLLRVTAPGTTLARLGNTELVCAAVGQHDRVADAVARITTEVNETSLRSARVVVRSTSAVATVDHTSNTKQVAYGLVTRARLELDASRLRDRSISESDDATAEPRSHERIRAVIESGGPRVVYQPICSTVDRSVVGYEALSRFPTGFGSPQAWFTAAAQTGQSAALELAAIRNALGAAPTLPNDAFLCVNASATTILTTELPTVLATVGPSRRLIVELTEHDMVDDYAALSEAVSVLRSAGVGIAVDDVGSGYAGLRHVVEVRPNVIKLDASIVGGIDGDPIRRAAAKSIVGLAVEIGAQTIFEGVETRGELESAHELGASMVQGFLVGRPREVTTIP